MYFSAEDYFSIKLIGEMRFSIAASLEKALIKFKKEMEDKTVIVDISGLVYADSTILGVLTGFFIREEDENALRIHAPIMVCNDSDFKRVLSNIGFDQYFNFKDFDERCNERSSNFTKVDLM